MKSILFDLDGTLVNSSSGIKSSFRYTFEQLNLTVPDDKVLSTFIGPPLETTFSNLFRSEELVKKAIAYFRLYYKEKGVHDVFVYQGIYGALTDLKAANYELYVTTSKNESMAQFMLDELGLSKFFKAIYGATPHRFKKDDVIRACLLSENINQNEALIIGDTKFDIIGGISAGIKTLGITWGSGLEADLLNSGADKICHSPDNIKKVLTF
ncbi:HAD hydrolase-like protein [Streptococcus sp. H31]|uniref:HAD hydrolase-like protein n=1 Tax=Streptococcus huangxiaojuni TaxID=3237239 RepID=UPI0034A2AAB5